MRNDRHFGSATPARSEVEGMQSGPPVEQRFSPEAPPFPLSSRPELLRSVVERSAVQRSFPGGVFRPERSAAERSLCGCSGNEPQVPLFGTLCRKTFPRESIHTEISPLRYAPVEMTKGRVALPGRAVAGLKHPMSESIHTEISPLRYAPVEMTKGKVALPGRTVAGLKHPMSESIHTEISPLRCAPVEMTKGKVALPGRAVAGLKHSQERAHPHRDPSAALRSGQDDKGEGGASGESSSSTEHSRRGPLDRRSLRCATLRS